MNKLPYIPNKKLYAAVMWACKLVKENGYFNQACTRAANYYDVDVESVKYYVRIAQGNGQRRANKRNPRKYYWFLIEYIPDYITCDDGVTQFTMVKATSEENARKRVSQIIMSIKKFKTQKEATDYLISSKKGNRH